MSATIIPFPILRGSPAWCALMNKAPDAIEAAQNVTPPPPKAQVIRFPTGRKLERLLEEVRLNRAISWRKAAQEKIRQLAGYNQELAKQKKQGKARPVLTWDNPWPDGAA